LGSYEQNRRSEEVDQFHIDLHRRNIAVPKIGDSCVVRYGYEDTFINQMVYIEQGKQFNFRQIGAFSEYTRTHPIVGINVRGVERVCLWLKDEF
jgi:hypothetical protein